MEIITKDKIYFQKQDIRHLQSLEGHYSIAESIADELRYYVKNTVVTPQNKKEYLTIDAQVDTTDMWAFIFAPLYNEVRWLSLEDVKHLVEVAIREKNKAVKLYNRHYDFDPRHYEYLKTERKIAEYRLICLKEYLEYLNGEGSFVLPEGLENKSIPIFYVPEEKGFFKRLFKK